MLLFKQGTKIILNGNFTNLHYSMFLFKLMLADRDFNIENKFTLQYVSI